MRLNRILIYFFILLYGKILIKININTINKGIGRIIGIKLSQLSFKMKNPDIDITNGINSPIIEINKRYIPL